MVMSLLVVLVAAPACASPQTTVYVAPSAMTVTVGQIFSVNVEISDVVDLYGWEFTLKWNSTFLDVLNVNEGEFLKSGGDTFFWPIMNNTEGYILADCTLIGNITGVNGSGTLAIVEFKVEGAGESILDLYDTKLVNSLEQPMAHTSNDGYVTTSELLGDVNGDNKVNYIDLFALADAYGSEPGDDNWDERCDFNGDNQVNYEDLFILADHYGMFI
jgi:hypothetical protein